MMRGLRDRLPDEFSTNTANTNQVKIANLNTPIGNLPRTIKSVAILLATDRVSREYRRKNDIKEPIDFGKCMSADILHPSHLEVVDRLMVVNYKNEADVDKYVNVSLSLEDIQVVIQNSLHKKGVHVFQCVGICDSLLKDLDEHGMKIVNK